MKLNRTTCVCVAAALLSFLQTGCGTLKPTPDTTRYFTLTAPSTTQPPGAVPAPDTPLIGVRVTSLAAHLRRPEIAVHVSEHELKYASDHRWADKIDTAVEQAVATGVQQRLGSRATVMVAPPLRAPAPTVLIQLDVLACEGDSSAPNGGAALFNADWRILGRDGKSIAASGRFVGSKSGWNGVDYAQLATLLAAAVDDLAATLAGPAAGIAGETR